jgi:hypothetical protein
MKFVFPILSILVCGAAIYFSLSEMERFDSEQQARLTAKTTNVNVSKSLAEANLAVGNEEDLLAAAKEQLATATASASFLQSSVTNPKNELAGLNNTLGLQEEESAEVVAALENVNRILIGEGGNATQDNFQKKFNEIEDEIETKESRIDEIQTLIEGATSSLATNQAEVERMIQRMAQRNRRIASNAMEARITAVNQEWGFLVIGAGSNSGFTPQTVLLVKRDGRLIGKVTPSAVEPTQTIAEIDLESLAPGVRIQPGDRVILAKPASN